MHVQVTDEVSAIETKQESQEAYRKAESTDIC